MPEASEREERDLDQLVEDAAEGLWQRLRDAVQLMQKLEGFVF